VTRSAKKLSLETKKQLKAQRTKFKRAQISILLSANCRNKKMFLVKDLAIGEIV
jgi:hypothetical protein